MISLLRSAGRVLAPIVFLLSACTGPARNADYNQELDTASISQAASLSSVCTGCHGADQSNEGIVSLQGYSALRISVLFRKYKNDPNGPTAMHRMARGYSDEEIKMIATYLAKQDK